MVPPLDCCNVEFAEPPLPSRLVKLVKLETFSVLPVPSLSRSTVPVSIAVSAGIAGTSICARTMTRRVHGYIVGDGEEAAAVAPLGIGRSQQHDRCAQREQQPERVPVSEWLLQPGNGAGLVQVDAGDMEPGDHLLADGVQTDGGRDQPPERDGDR